MYAGEGHGLAVRVVRRQTAGAAPSRGERVCGQPFPVGAREAQEVVEVPEPPDTLQVIVPNCPADVIVLAGDVMDDSGGEDRGAEPFAVRQQEGNHQVGLQAEMPGETEVRAGADSEPAPARLEMLALEVV